MIGLCLIILISLSFISEFILDLILIKKTLYSFLWHILLYASNLFRFFAHAFSARANVITHIAIDWLFRHALLSIKMSPLFERVAIGYSKYKYAVSIAY